jgi:hypothetical protein
VGKETIKTMDSECLLDAFHFVGISLHDDNNDCGGGGGSGGDGTGGGSGDDDTPKYSRKISYVNVELKTNVHARIHTHTHKWVTDLELTWQRMRMVICLQIPTVF